MLILFTILVILSAAVALRLLSKARTSPPTENHGQIEPPPFRGLFEPSETEMRARERRQSTCLLAEKDRAVQLALEKKQKIIYDFQTVWRSLPDKKNTIELIRLAAEGGSGIMFCEIAQTVIKHWRTGQVAALSGGDLAAVLESHFRLLPTEERTSGVAFWLKREIADLRAKSAGKN